MKVLSVAYPRLFSRLLTEFPFQFNHSNTFSKFNISLHLEITSNPVQRELGVEGSLYFLMLKLQEYCRPLNTITRTKSFLSFSITDNKLLFQE